jgi:hypothetical protein
MKRFEKTVQVGGFVGAEPVDGLVWVPHNYEIHSMVAQKCHQEQVVVAGVLDLVHDDFGETVGHQLPELLAVVRVGQVLAQRDAGCGRAEDAALHERLPEPQGLSFEFFALPVLQSCG